MAQVAVLVPLVAGVVADHAGITAVLLAVYLALAIVFAMVNWRDRGPRTRDRTDEALRGVRG